MSVEEFLAEWHDDSPTLLVHTSGSTGEPKPMWVEKRRMAASARITCDFLGLHEGDTALLCMPLDYIAGKMMVVRSLVRGLRLTAVPPSGHPFKPNNEELGIKNYDFSASDKPAGSGNHNYSFSNFNSSFSLAAMVPMQVWNTLQVADERRRLMAVKHLIIGGGAINESLAAELRTFPNAVWSTYGMTETLSHIALRRLNGPEASEWYTPFPGVTLSQNADGCLVIDAPAVHDGPLVTNDIVTLHSPLSTFNPQPIPFRILGRMDNVICSGGIKIQAEEVERCLHDYLRSPYLITKRRDEKFGEVVVLLTEGDTAEAMAVCQRVLPKYWQPRAYVHTPHIPLTATGKPARKEAERLAEK